jgi:hypothetical protein
MAMPAHLEAWWQEHPEKWKQRHHYSQRFPENGSRDEQLDWFRRLYLKKADKASNPKERDEYLKLALQATVKKKGENPSDSAEALYREHLERQIARQEARMRDSTNVAGK